MKKSVVASLFYALFLLLGHGGNNGANAQTGLNPYDDSGMKDGTKLARNCALDAANQERVQHMRDALNRY